MMAMIVTQLPDAIERHLARFGRRRRAQRIVRAAGVAVIVTLIWAALWCLVDRVVALPASVRMALVIVNAVAIVLLLARPILAALRAHDWVRLARDVERRERSWGERLWTVTSRLTGPAELRGSPQMLAALADDVAAEAMQRDAATLLRWRAVFRPWIVAVLLVMLLTSVSLALPALDLPRLMKRYAMPLEPISPAATTRIDVAPGNVEINEGRSLRVIAAAQRLGDSPLALHFRRAGQDWAESPMVKLADGKFEARVADVMRDVEYYITGGDARSLMYTATVRLKPAVALIAARLNYPAYTRVSPRDVTIENGLIEAPAGTDATLTVTATEPIGSMTLVVGAAVVQTAPTSDPRVRQATINIREDRRYLIRLTSTRGLESVFRGGVIRATVDRPPIVTIDASRVNQSADGGATIEFPYYAVDDFGLMRLDVEVRRGDDAERALTLPIERGAREQSGLCRLNLAALTVSQGDEISIRLRGEDRAGQFAISAPLRLSIAAATKTPVDLPVISAEPTANPPTEQDAPIDPTGYSGALKAYFDAIRTGNYDRGPNTAK